MNLDNMLREESHIRSDCILWLPFAWTGTGKADGNRRQRPAARSWDGA